MATLKITPAPLEVLRFADGWSVETISHGSGRILWGY